MFQNRFSVRSLFVFLLVGILSTACTAPAPTLIFSTTTPPAYPSSTSPSASQTPLPPTALPQATATTAPAAGPAPVHARSRRKSGETFCLTLRLPFGSIRAG